MAKKIKWSVTSADLDNVEEDAFEPYDGPTPPKGVYRGRIKSAKVTESSNGNNMIKLLIIVDGAASGKPKYDGAPIWDNVVDTPQTAFRVARFLTGVSGTKRDWANTMVDEDGNIIKMGRIKLVGMLIRFSTKLEEYEGDHDAKIDRYLPPKDEEPEEDEEEEDEESDEEDSEEDDEDSEDDEEEEEEEEEPAPAPRRAAKKAAPSRKAAAPAKKAAAKRAPARRRRDDDDEPPF